MEDVSVLSLLGRLVFSLAVVLVLMYLVARVMRNKTMPGVGRIGARRDLLQVVARQTLSRTASIAVVHAADRALVVGVTDHGVSVLAELDVASLEPDEPDDATPIAAGPSWQGFLDALRERSVRRS
jgi:flagellar protein FliO/FliZ